GVGYREGTEARVVAGPPAEAVLREAMVERACLIVMGTRGRGALTRAILGSTARDVLRQATVPVAIVPPSDPEIATLAGARTIPRFGIVLVPVDMKSAAPSQMAVTGLLGSGSQHRPMLLHVTDAGSDHVLIRERMTPLVREIPGGRGAKLLVLEGDVAEAIVRVTQKDDVGLVILGRARDAAGQIACAVLERTRAVVVVVP
ncbi:MAG: universal stress protein, partial [Vicinamibacterales bacterium]